MASIADLFAKLLLDDSGFEASVVKSATKAGDAAGQTMGQRMSATLKTTLGVGAKVAATALAGGLAIAARGAAELENITADFQAATGASADEAEATAKVINRVSGDERQSLQSVTDVAVRVKRDLGANGTELAKLTGAYTKFGRVTKQDAAGAVADFDDILDAWGLTASDSVEIMDKLLVSQQRFGGSITESQKALAALAPSLKAANLNIDDGIGLLNLFQASGVDAAVAVTGMTKALTKVKSPAELKALIADIIATEDPFLRAQKASDLFGAKAGAKLANALKPGAKALDEYQISVEDAAGATDKAADIIDNTFTGRIQKAISQATAGLREFGQGFGPAVTGLASLATLAAPFGGKLVGGILGPIGGLGKKLAVKLAAAIGIGFAGQAVTGAAEAGGGLIGDLSVKQIQKRLAGTAMADAAATGLIGAAESGPVAKASSSLGTKMGGLIGLGIIGAIAAAAAIGAKAAKDQANKEFADAGIEANFMAPGEGVLPFGIEASIHNVLEFLRISGPKVQDALHDAIVDPMDETARQTAKSTADITAQISTIPDEIDSTFDAMDVEGNLKASITDPMDETARGVRLAAQEVGLSVDSIGPHTKDLVTTGGAAFLTVGDDARGMTQRILDSVDKIKAAVHGLATNLAAEARAMITGYYGPLILQDNLLATNAQIAGAKRVLASKKTTDAEKADARALLHSLGQTQADYILQLAEAGDTSSKAYKDGLKSLKKAISEAKGPAKKALQEILDKILEVEKAGKVVPINVQVNQRGNIGVSGARAEGGPWRKGEISWVGEKGPELMEAGGDAFVTPADVSKRAVARMKSPAGIVPVRPGASPSVGAGLADGVKAAAAAFVGAVVPSLRMAIVQLGTTVKAVPPPVKAPPVPPVTVNVIVEPPETPPVGGRPLTPDAAAPRLVAAATAQKVKRMPGPGMPQAFATGGIVSGPPGQPVPIIAHGGEEVVPAKDRKPEPVSAAIVKTITRTLSEVAHRVSDTTIVLRRIVENVERTVVQAGPTITVPKPGVPKPGTPTPIAAPPPKPGYPASVTPAPVTPRAVAQAVQARARQMREVMLPGPWMPAAAIADVGGSVRPPAAHVPSFRAPSIAPARVPSGLAAVPAAGGGSVREGDIHVNLLDKLEVRSVRDIGGGLRMLGEQGYLGRKGAVPPPQYRQGVKR